MAPAEGVLAAELEVLTGASRGLRQRLDSQEAIVGRHESCDLIIADPTVSRRHARFAARDDGFYVEDLKSLNGTLLNGRRIGEAARLQHGDVLHMHRVVLVFHQAAAGETAGRSEVAYTASVELPIDSKRVAPRPHVKAVLDAQRVVPQGELSPGARAMGELFRNLSSSLEEDQLLYAILESVFQAFPQTDRGLILLEHSGGGLKLRSIKFRPSDTGSMLTFGPLSTTLAGEAFCQSKALLCTDSADGGEADREIVTESELHTMMCAPLIGSGGAPVGIIHLDAHDSARPFVQDDLQSFLMMAIMAGQAIGAKQEANRPVG